MPLYCSTVPQRACPVPLFSLQENSRSRSITHLLLGCLVALASRLAMSHEWQKRTAEVALLNFDAWLMRQAAEEQLDERWTKPMAIRHTREQKAAWRIVDEDRTAALRQKEAVRIMSTPYVMSLFMVPDSDSEEEEEEAAAEPQHNDHADQPEAAAAPASYSLQHAEEEPEPEVEGSALDDALHQMQLGIMACSSRIRSRGL